MGFNSAFNPCANIKIVVNSLLLHT
jgi:hypothetical protein